MGTIHRAGSRTVVGDRAVGRGDGVIERGFKLAAQVLAVAGRRAGRHRQTSSKYPGVGSRRERPTWPGWLCRPYIPAG